MTFSLDFTAGAEEQYLLLLHNILAYGSFKKDRTGVGIYELSGYSLRYDLQKGFPLLTTKKMFYRGLVEELLWMMRGETHVKSLQEKNVNIWNEWATEEQCARFGRLTGDLGPVYGHQWRNFGASAGKHTSYAGDGIDQLDNALSLIRMNPESRRIIVSSWNPHEAGMVALPPCHTLFQFVVRDSHGEKFLDSLLYQRSGDVFLGVPFNIASYALLTHIMAELAGIKPGTLYHTIASAHIYTNHLDQVTEQLNRKPFNLPTVQIKTFQRHTPDRYHLWAIDDFLAECYGASDFEFLDYQSHSAIKAEVAV